tara:strand:- start:1182 stop:1409 length:228 start_codon:yes stop_codon:yes gene_type:complete
MRKNIKLTPAKIKQIISEEKAKLDRELQESRKREQKKLLEMLRLLKKIQIKESKYNDGKLVLAEMKRKLINKIKR